MFATSRSRPMREDRHHELPDALQLGGRPSRGTLAVRGPRAERRADCRRSTARAHGVNHTRRRSHGQEGEEESRREGQVTCEKAQHHEGVGPRSSICRPTDYASDRDRHESRARHGDRPLRRRLPSQTRALMRTLRRPQDRRPRAPRVTGSVVLVAMPWHVLHLPSIQLGTLRPLLEDAGIRIQVRSYTLDFMEHCRVATREQPENLRIGLPDYEAVAVEHYWVGLGEWIFAGPPFSESTERDAAYLDYVRSQGVPERDIDKARRMRELVPAFLEACVDDLSRALPRVVGFTSTFSQTVPSLALAKKLKQSDPSLIIVFGGANCDGPMGAALLRAFPWVDVVVRGEAEPIVVEVMRDLLAGRSPRPSPGLCYRDAGGLVVIDQAGGDEFQMDRLPIPDYSEYFERLAKTGFAPEILGEARLPFESARGCWWGAKSHCTFCGLNGSSMTFRSKSPARVLQEVETLVQRYGRLDLQAVDNIMDMRYLRDVLPHLRDRGYDLGLFYETKANLRKDQLQLLRQSGVDHIQPGIESLSTPILTLMRKGVTAFQNVRL